MVSLDKYMFNQEKASPLDWDMKFKIVVEVAQGIIFWVGKISTANKEAVTLAAARGTIGYVALELINRSIGVGSYKADVYSFGMLLMEMVSLNKDFTRNNDESSKYFPNWIYDHLNQGRDIDIRNVDKNDDKNIGRMMTIVAL
ncbi:rust resistance kinase Lr10-like [Salvia splendens]|uniref:rust resistance kinase Lr10-like n=1 Tax=Salvia splendens TaxID=180675 RepID=UPI001C2552EA|nr:rust resistance kinase Lr10-like [Salvia splendens]